MPARRSGTAVSSSRQRLLRAAGRLFAAKGYEQTTTAAIARAAGTSESQLVRNFGGKAGVLDALLDAAWTRLERRAARAIQTADTTREAITGAASAIASTLARDAPLTSLLLVEGRRLRADGPHVHVPPGFAALAARIGGLVRTGQSTGEIDRWLDADAVASAILGATEAMVRDRRAARAGIRARFGPRAIQRTLAAMVGGLDPRVRSRTRRRRAPRARAAR
jgi:TetR/AcrR family transcriptional regulator